MQYLRSLIARNSFPHPLTPAEERNPFLFGVTPGNAVETGPVAQRIRARGYEPRCRGFESLLAHPERGQKGGLFGGREIMIGIADAKLWNLVFTKGPRK